MLVSVATRDDPRGSFRRLAPVLARTPNRTRQALLGFLSWGPLSGYGLRKVIDGSVSNFWTESYGRIYPMLKELEEEGLATSMEASTPGGRPTKTYSITDAGRHELASWLGDDEVGPTPRRNEMLLKLFFAARAEGLEPERIVEAFRALKLEELERYAETRAELEAATNPPPDMAYWKITLRYGELEARAHVDWADETLKMLWEAVDAADAAYAAARDARRSPDDAD